MLQKNKKLKIVSIVLLVLLVNSSINAAVVSDNDGASFITKAEFDSAKNSFQATINDFNTSIDDKISNAISAYIAGAKDVINIINDIIKIEMLQADIDERFPDYKGIVEDIIDRINNINK